MMLRSTRTPRRAATLAEAAIVLPIFFLIVLGMIDLGIAVSRHNTLSNAARHGSRRAAVHGSKCLSGFRGGPWGPTTVGPLAASATTHPVLDEVRPMLTGVPTDDARITVEWPDASNEIEKRVRVTITCPYSPFVLSVFGISPFTLKASSTMPVAH